MSMLAGLGMVNAALRGVSSVAHQLKQPKASEDKFSAALRQALESNNGAGTDKQAQTKRAEEAAKKFMGTYDVNGNGGLSVAESGIRAQNFTQWDADGNGELNVSELQRAFAYQLESSAQRK